MGEGNEGEEEKMEEEEEEKEEEGEEEEDDEEERQLCIGVRQRHMDYSRMIPGYVWIIHE